MAPAARPVDPVTPADPVEEAAPASRGWTDAPIGGKLSSLVLLTATGGLLSGAIESAAGNRIWPLLVGMGLTIALGHRLAGRTVAEPLEQLTAEMERARRTRRPPRRAALPVRRQDEIGNLAGISFELATEAYRHSTAAKHLRRELDRRVAESTRQATQELRQLAMRDALTDLGNRRFLDAHLEPLVQSCRSSKTELICLAIDMDGFKRVNDQLGHAAGDRLLVLLATLLRTSIRSEDLAARLGGDEFVVLMPGCTLERAQRAVRRIMELLAQQTRITLPPGIRVSLSCGLASMQRDQPESGKQLLELADEKLYTAKHAGKNRVES